MRTLTWLQKYTEILGTYDMIGNFHHSAASHMQVKYYVHVDSHLLKAIELTHIVL